MRRPLRHPFSRHGWQVGSRASWLAALILPLNAVATDDIEKLTVSGWREGESATALPSELRLDGAFGADRSLKDTPRAVTSLTPDLLERFGVTDLHDLSRVAPNLYGANTFGTASLPRIRGQFGEIFVDGLRRQGGNNGLGLPLSFNAFEQVSIRSRGSEILFVCGEIDFALIAVSDRPKRNYSGITVYLCQYVYCVLCSHRQR